MVAAACRRILEDHDASSAHYLSAARLHLPFPRDSFYQSVSLDGLYFRFNDGGSDSLAQKVRSRFRSGYSTMLNKLIT